MRDGLGAVAELQAKRRGHVILLAAAGIVQATRHAFGELWEALRREAAHGGVG